MQYLIKTQLKKKKHWKVTDVSLYSQPISRMLKGYYQCHEATFYNDKTFMFVIRTIPHLCLN